MHQHTFFRHSKTILQIALMLISVLVSVVILELGLHTFGKEKYVTHNWLSTYPENWDIDPTLIFVPKKIKNLLKNFQQESDKPLIITIGDSFTQGDPVPEADNFPSQLQLELKSQGNDVSVLNVGVGGYGPDQELALLKSILNKGIKPDIVIWQFFPNDLYENSSQVVYTIENGKLLQIDGRKSWIYKVQKLYRLIPLPNQIKQKSRLLNHLFSYIDNKLEYSSVPSEFRDDYDQMLGWSVDKTSLQIEALNKLAEEHHFKVYTVLISPQYVYLSNEEKEQKKEALAWLEEYEEKLEEIISGKTDYLSLDFRTLSQDPQFKKHISVVGDEQKNFYFDDGSRDPMEYGNRHFNEAGYQTWAKVFSSKIRNDVSSASATLH